MDPNYDSDSSEDEEESVNIYDIRADQENICISTDHGKIYSYEHGSLKLCWELQVCEKPFQLFMNKQNIFAVNSNDAGHAYIIDRTNGFLIKSLLDLHSDRIWGVQVFENKILATASSNGFIKFHEIMEDYEIKLMYEEEQYSDKNCVDMLIESSIIKPSNRRHQKFCAIRKRQLRTLRTIVRLC